MTAADKKAPARAVYRLYEEVKALKANVKLAMEEVKDRDKTIKNYKVDFQVCIFRRLSMRMCLIMRLSLLQSFLS